MARVTIELPEHFEFSTDLEIRIQHINRGNHLGNDCLVSFLNEARVRYMEEAINTMRENAIWMINADLAVVYKSEGFYGEILTVEVQAGDFHKCGFDLFFRLTNKQSGVEVAHAKMAMLLMDSSTRALVYPEEGVEKFLEDYKKN